MRTIDRFQITGEIDRGAMGVVYRARDPQLGRDVAIKVLLDGRRPDERERFLREARASARLDHPNIVYVHATGALGELPYMVMELIDGESLGARLARGGPLPPREAARVAAQLARALQHAHEEGVLHRDLKPSNVLLDARRADRPRLTDFGLAKLAGADSLTNSGDILGTPAYMAPEQVMGDREVIGPHTDVFGLGAILFHMLCGRAPVKGNSIAEALNAVLHTVPSFPTAPERERDTRLEAICLRCLAKAPQDRYDSMTDLAGELEGYLAAPPLAPAGPGRWILSSLAVVPLLIAVGVALSLPSALPPPEQPTPPPVTPRGAPAIQEITLQPGPVEGQDTFVKNVGLYINDNYGSHPGLIVGDRKDQEGDHRAFLRFDLSFLPSGARIVEAKLALWFVKASRNDGDMVIQVQAVVASDASRTPWEEGTESKDALLDGMVWKGDHQPAPGSRWARLGNHPAIFSARPDLSQPDVEPDVIARLEISSSAVTGWVEADITSAVERWVRGDLDNLGIRLAHTTEGPPYHDGVKLFQSSDSLDSDQRPKLRLRYEGPPVAPPDPVEIEGEARATADALLDALDEAPPESREEHFWAINRIVQVAPSYGRTRLARAKAHQWMGDLRSASTELRRAMNSPSGAELGPEIRALYAEVGRKLIEEGHVGESRSTIRSALQGWPNDPELLELDRRAKAMRRR